MKLNMRTEMTHYVDFFDLETYIEQAFGLTYEIVAGEECGNDTDLHFNVRGVVDSNDHIILNEMIKGVWHPYRTHMLLEFLANMKLIPTGSYIIKVSW